MTDEEAKELYRRIWITYPDFLSWVQEKSPDPAATLAQWRRMLSDVPHAVGALIVRELETGKRKMPEAYDRGRLGSLLRSWCMFVVDAEKRREANEKLQAMPPASAHAVILGDSSMCRCFRALNAADDRHKSGEITAEERLRLRSEAWSEFRAKPARTA